MLKLEQLTKEHPGGFKLGPVSIEAHNGDTIAVFGRNGAGKSTLFSIITGNQDRTSGDVYWDEHKISPDAVEMKKKIGYLPQESDLPHWLTPLEIVTWAAKLHGLPETTIHETLQLWDITAWAHKPLISGSHGMQKRVGLAVSTMHDPKVLILDEAFNALDIFHTRTLEQLIHGRTQRGLLTLLSTHSPLIAAQLCPKAWIIESGKLRVLSQWPSSSLLDRVQIVEQHFFAPH
jgi:ABC-2 type transport system ATP-binding protein